MTTRSRKEKVPTKDPYPNDLGDTSNCIFDVTSFSAVGEGSSDDTLAFREAWKTTCAVESATIQAPSNKIFIITSTIFKAMQTWTCLSS